MKNYPAIAKRKAKAREFLRLFLRQLLPISAINALLFPHVSLLLLLLFLFLFLFHFHFHFHSLFHSLHWFFPLFPNSSFSLLCFHLFFVIIHIPTPFQKHPITHLLKTHPIPISTLHMPLHTPHWDSLSCSRLLGIFVMFIKFLFKKDVRKILKRKDSDAGQRGTLSLYLLFFEFL